MTSGGIVSVPEVFPVTSQALETRMLKMMGVAIVVVAGLGISAWYFPGLYKSGAQIVCTRINS